MQQVIAVSLCATHAFSKQVRPAIRLLKGLGVEGDAHHGVTVKHRSRVRQDPTQPNLRQVHLIHDLRGHSAEPGHPRRAAKIRQLADVPAAVGRR